MTPDELVEIHAIERLKYRYARCLDLKRWDELRACFTKDASAAYSGGKFSYDSPDGIIEFLSTSLGNDMVSRHHVHQPEIDLTGPDTATGTWALDDIVINTTHHFEVRGAAFYTDEYVKVDGEWKIKRTGYERIYEEIQERQKLDGLKLLESWTS